MMRSSRKLLARVMLGGAGLLLAGCSSVPIPPTYTQEELKTICERRAGVWYPDDLIGGFCEYRRGEGLTRTRS